MIAVIVDVFGKREQVNGVRMVSNYPDLSIIYMDDGSKLEVSGAQSVTCIDERISPEPTRRVALENTWKL